MAKPPQCDKVNINELMRVMFEYRLDTFALTSHCSEYQMLNRNLKFKCQKIVVKSYRYLNIFITI